MISQDVALSLIRDRPWHHAFEIVPGVRTTGTYDPEGLWTELRLPDDLTGVSLADVGASNGYFSFAARRRGARVVAFDARHKDNSGFGLLQHINGMSDIEHHHINVLDITREAFGEFDIVLALGLLYHVSDPYLALANCAALARDRLLVESYCIDSPTSPELAAQPIMRFCSDPVRFPDQGNVNEDRSVFWGFSSTCLRQMVEDVGFAVRRTGVREDRVLIDSTRQVAKDKTRLNLAYRAFPRTPVGAAPDDPVAWTMF